MRSRVRRMVGPEIESAATTSPSGAEDRRGHRGEPELELVDGRRVAAVTDRSAVRRCRASNAVNTLPFAVDSYGTRRPTQFVPPTKCALSSCARCSAPSGVGTPRLIVSPESSARALERRERKLDEARPTGPDGRSEAAPGPGATRAVAGALHEPPALERAEEPRGRALRQARARRELARPRAAGSISTTLTSSSAARSIACVRIRRPSRPYGGT